MLIWTLITLLLSIGLVLIVSQLDFRAIYTAYKKQSNIEKERPFFSRNVSKYRLIKDLEKRIEKSNIRFYINYSPWTHLFLCFISCVVAVNWMNQQMNYTISLIFGVGVSIIPYILLQLFSDLMGYRVKRMSVDFLIILRRFMVGSKRGDIFEAFNKASKYVLQPLKNYIEIFVYEYENKTNPIQCFENLKDRIENSELVLYVENLQICYVRGGDMIELTDTFIEEIDKQNDEDDEENAKDMMLSMGLYILIGVNFLILYMLFNSSYKRAVFDSDWGQIVFVLDMIVSFYIAYLTLEKVS